MAYKKIKYLLEELNLTNRGIRKIGETNNLKQRIANIISKEKFKKENVQVSIVEQLPYDMLDTDIIKFAVLRGIKVYNGEYLYISRQEHKDLFDFLRKKEGFPLFSHQNDEDDIGVSFTPLRLELCSKFCKNEIIYKDIEKTNVYIKLTTTKSSYLVNPNIKRGYLSKELNGNNIPLRNEILEVIAFELVPIPKSKPLYNI